jgi:hypothetical protein
MKIVQSFIALALFLTLMGCGDGFSDAEDAFGSYVTTKEIVVSGYNNKEGGFDDIVEEDVDSDPTEIRLGKKTFDLGEMKDIGKLEYRLRGNFLEVHSGGHHTLTILRKDGKMYLEVSELWAGDQGSNRTLLLMEEK